MKVKETFVSFTGFASYGKFAFFVELSKVGIPIEAKELAKQAIHFPRVVISGEPYNDREELAKFVRWTTKDNPNIVIEIYSDGMIRPIKIGSFTNIQHNVVLQLKHTGVEYDKRINESSINWYNEIGANFIFKIKDGDDLDEVRLLVNQYSIPKARIILTPYDNDMDFVITFARKHGFNFILPLREQFWNDLGRK